MFAISEGNADVYYESIDKKHILWPLLERPFEGEYNQIKFLLGLIESGLVRLTIIDEHIFNYFKDKPVPRDEIKMMKIDIPEINYSKPCYAIVIQKSFG